MLKAKKLKSDSVV